jgi:septal ring factor EnvC (AmiA/AmiB activator)
VALCELLGRGSWSATGLARQAALLAWAGPWAWPATVSLEHHLPVQASPQLVDRTAERGMSQAQSALQAAQAQVAGQVTWPPFTGLQGQLRPPVAGERVAGFGTLSRAPHGTQLRHPGWTFATARSASVQAVATGRVAYVGPAPGFDLVVILDHGQGFHSLYANLAAVTPRLGDRVELGQPLGSVNESQRLYFELCQYGQPIDPASWIRLEATGSRL